MEQQRDIGISFVIPVYNTGAALQRMTDSVSGFRDTAYEIILVDDGSNDEGGSVSTAALVDALAAGHPEIHAIHTENHGAASARLVGMRAARGKYISFVDADDELLPAGLRKLYRKAEERNCDIICGSYIRSDGRKETRFFCRGLQEGDILLKEGQDKSSNFEKLRGTSAFGYLWNKLFRRDFLHRADENAGRTFFYREGPTYMNDQMFLLELLCEKPTFYYYGVPVYHYITQAGRRTESENIPAKCMNTLYNYYTFLDEHAAASGNLYLLVPFTMKVQTWCVYCDVMHGLGGKKLEKAIMERAKNPAFLYLKEQDERTRKELKTMNSITQRAVFSWMYTMLKKGKYAGAAAAFSALSPFMRIYEKVMIH